MKCKILSDIRNSFTRKLPVLTCTETNDQDRTKRLLGNMLGVKGTPIKLDELEVRVDFLDKMVVTRASMINRKIRDHDLIQMTENSRR